VFVLAHSEARSVVTKPVAETGSDETIPAVFSKLTADQLSTNGKCVNYNHTFMHKCVHCAYVCINICIHSSNTSHATCTYTHTHTH